MTSTRPSKVRDFCDDQVMSGSTRGWPRSNRVQKPELGSLKVSGTEFSLMGGNSIGSTREGKSGRVCQPMGPCIHSALHW
jgi:hypothetical protein